MSTLIIDTSSEYCFLALIQEQRLLASTLFLHENRLSHSLIDCLVALTQKADLSLKTLQGIAVGVGPGSYTGTRVGVAVAKGLGFGLNIPVRGYCSLLGFLPACVGTFLCLLPAKSGLIYCLKGSRGQTLSLHAAELVTPERLALLTAETDSICAKLDFDHFCTLPSGRDALMRNFNSRDGVFKPIPGIKITPEGISIQNEGHKNGQSRAKLPVPAKNFLPFQPNFDAIIQALEQPCVFPFEEKAELIYLHQPS